MERRRFRIPSRLSEEPGLMLTPLIDMIFLVLIFFVINSSIQMEPGVEVDLPEASTGKNQEAGEIVVTITGEGVLYIGDREVSRRGFPEMLRRILEEEKPAKGLTIRGDRSMPYGLLMDVMDLSRSYGVYNISLVTDEGP